MEIIINGGKTIVNPLFNCLSYSAICNAALMNERHHPAVNCAYPDGRNCSVFPGGSADVVPGMVINVAHTNNA